MLRPVGDALFGGPLAQIVLTSALLAFVAALVGHRRSGAARSEPLLLWLSLVPAVLGAWLAHRQVTLDAAVLQQSRGSSMEAAALIGSALAPYWQGLFWTGVVLLAVAVLRVRERPESNARSVLALGLVCAVFAGMTSPAALSRVYGWVPVAMLGAGWVGFRARAGGYAVAGPVWLAGLGALVIGWASLAAAESDLFLMLSTLGSEAVIYEEISRKTLVTTFGVLLLGWASLRGRPWEASVWLLSFPGLVTLVVLDVWLRVQIGVVSDYAVPQVVRAAGLPTVSVSPGWASTGCLVHQRAGAWSTMSLGDQGESARARCEGADPSAPLATLKNPLVVLTPGWRTAQVAEALPAPHGMEVRVLVRTPEMLPAPVAEWGVGSLPMRWENRVPELEPNVWLAEDDGVLSPSGQRYGWDNAAVAMSARGRGGEVDLVLAPGERTWQDWAVLCDAARNASENRTRCVVATAEPKPPRPGVRDAERSGQGRP